MLLSIFLFNVGGYYVVLWALRQHSNIVLSQRVDAEMYSIDETIELKIPLTLPYQLQEERNFERAQGKFEYRGEFYTLVKQKFQNDTLHIVCIKNDAEKRIVSSMTDYVKLSNDLPGASKKAVTFLGKLLKDFNPSAEALVCETERWSRDIIYTDARLVCISPIRSLTTPPPKA
jgi:hypothetical protein